MFSSRALLAVRLAVGAVQNLGARTIFPITGGTVEGRLTGKVLPGGADWAVLRPDGVLEVDVRITLEATDGGLVYLAFQGLRHGEYFRTIARFETVAPQLLFLNRMLAVGRGEIRDGVPVHTFEEIV